MRLNLEQTMALLKRVEDMPNKTLIDKVNRFLVIELEGFCAGIREDDEYSQGYKQALLRLRDVLEGQEEY